LIDPELVKVSVYKIIKDAWSPDGASDGAPTAAETGLVSKTSWGSSPAELQYTNPAGCVQPQGFCLSTSAEDMKPHAEHVASGSPGLMNAVRTAVQRDKDVVMYNEYVAKNYRTGPYHSFENWKTVYPGALRLADNPGIGPSDHHKRVCCYLSSETDF
jgi:hypothetical protein